MKKLVLLFTAFLLCSFAAVAQTGSLTITGQVITRDDNSALPGATVTIPDLGLSTTTDSEGRYRLEIPADQVRNQNANLVVEFQGLQTRTAQLRLSPGTITRDFGLAVTFGQEITVGSRVIGAAEEKAVPVDIITEEQLDTTGRTETMQAIQAIAPSFNFPRPTITDGTDTVRPATLRGLGPDQMLVMLNGKRRHPSALLHANNSVGRGSTGVDMNAIPAAALTSVEVLREGAAAQYGSDAIAGVLNLVLKSGVQAPTVELMGGTTTHGDGERLAVNATYGLPVGRGSLFLTGEFRDRGETNRARPDPRPQLNPNDAGNNAVPQPNHHWGDSEQTDILGFFNFNYPLTGDNRSYLYSFGGLAYREGSHGGFYRRALDARNWPQIYPLGFLPLIEPEVDDQSLTVGARGDLRGWFWDVSTQWGHSKFDFFVSNSLNVTLGPTSNQTDFYAGANEFAQWVTNADFSRGFNVGMAGPLNVAVGIEYRQDNYQIHGGEEASWRDYGHPDQFGGRAVPGAQVFPGWRPEHEVDVSRNNVGAYVDLEGDITQMLRAGLALRVEDYSDFGSTSDYKLTLRLAPMRQLVVRGSAQTGFRAPSLVQTYNSQTATNFLLNPATGQVEPFQVGTFPVNSPVARALGSRDLQPENSDHYSFGVVWEPITNLEVTVDAYHIDIEDRIVFSENFTQQRVRDILIPLGLGVAGARFFTNAIDTETDGLDLVVNHQRGLFGGRLDLSGAYSHNETDIVGTLQTPPQLVGLEETLFGHQERRRFTCAQPKDNIRLLQQFHRRGLTATLRESRYGEFCSLNTNPAHDQTYDAKWLTDLELAYKWSQYVFALGAENIFDVFPDENVPGTAQAFTNPAVFPYPGHSPFGMNGTIIYSRIGYTF